jgi:hypothetical protein
VAQLEQPQARPPLDGAEQDADARGDLRVPCGATRSARGRASRSAAPVRPTAVAGSLGAELLAEDPLAAARAVSAAAS